MVDVSTLTERQRQVGETAIEMGYFDSDGAGAQTVAEEFDISRSSLSQHLRAIIRKIFSQFFP